MNALIKKEIRLIFPAWIAAMLLVAVILPLLQFFSLNGVPYNPDFLPMPFGLGILFLSLASFGQEFSFKTFSLSLSQPVPRSRIWLVKIAILAVAFISVLLALFVCYKIYFYLRPVYNIPFPTWILILFGFVIFSGGLWATLLLRQMTGAFWFAILVPAFLMMALFEFSEHFHWSQKTQDFVIPAIFLIYSIAGFFWARHLFLNAQDAQWTGGEISFPWRRKISERTAVSSQPRHWLSALVRKEFQLHQGTILIAGLVLVLHLASVVIRKVHPNFENPNVKFILETVWALWLLMPLLIGSAAVAEERKLGVIESQLCLPVSRRAQLFVKFSVALILSLILGGVMPFIIERTRDFNHWIFVVAAVIFFISFYASTLARTTLQAIGIAIGFSALIGFYESSPMNNCFRFVNNYEVHQPVGLEILKVFLSGSILLVVLAWLIFGNFKWLHENWKHSQRNLIVIVTALVCSLVLANAIYFRAWEWLTPVESPHGPARLSDSSALKFISNGGVFSAILPDGRLWMNSIWFDYYSDSNAKKLIGHAQFIDGSNWTEVAPHWYETLAIKSDGTLWCLQGKWDESNGWTPSKLSQIGSETNWAHVATGNSRHFLLLKKDKSLWVWGTNEAISRTNLEAKIAVDLATPPARLDDETNWSGLFSGWNMPYAKKMDGSFWTLNLEKEETNSSFHLIQNTNLTDQWSVFIPYGEYAAGVKTNGELWFLAKPPANWNWNWNDNQFPPYAKKIQLGKNEKWKSVAFAEDNSLVTLRADGTLWRWAHGNHLNYFDSAKPVQLGNQSDWIVLPSNYNWNIIALAADGSIWAWENPSAHIWLAPSRKPLFIGNIFQGLNSKAE